MSHLTDDQVARIAARLAERLGRRSAARRPETPARSGDARRRPASRRGAGRPDRHGGGADDRPAHRTGRRALRQHRCCGAGGARGLRRTSASETLARRDRDHRRHPGSDASGRRGALPAWPGRRPGSGGWRTRSSRTGSSPPRRPGPRRCHPEAVSGDHGLTLFERAPYGVIGAITPVTNPTSTIICNTIGMLAAGNAVVFNAHPSARGVLVPHDPPPEPGDPVRRRAAQPRHARSPSRPSRRPRS